jgi:hypothetical protein
MLCQLVCVDRRYQRMNCFNIRELQGILKRKFFPDLINSTDHKFLDSSMIGLRFKNNTQDNIRSDQSLFYNLGISNSSKQKMLSASFGINPLEKNSNFFVQKINSILLDLISRRTSKDVCFYSAGRHRYRHKLYNCK